MIQTKDIALFTFVSSFLHLVCFNIFLYQYFHPGIVKLPREKGKQEHIYNDLLETVEDWKYVPNTSKRKGALKILFWEAYENVFKTTGKS